MLNTPLSRRLFLASSGVAATSAMVASSLPGFAQKNSNMIVPASKALVFVMLDGGNDSFNMLVPNEDVSYRQYAETRANLALPRNDLLPLDGPKDSLGRNFGLHKSMPELADLFNQKRASFIANIGPSVEPVTRATFQDGSAKLPLGLMSHSDQFKHWQTSRPDTRDTEGWFGHFADALQPSKAAQDVSMNISMAGHNIVQNGARDLPYSITDRGSVGLIVNEEVSDLNTSLLGSFNKLMAADQHGDPFRDTYLRLTRDAQAQHRTFQAATKDISVPTKFSDSDLAQQLKMVARTIAASERLEVKQQTFFVRYIGWDHHDSLMTNQARMLSVLSSALGEFQTALEEMGLAQRVVTFTGSDFGRTLTSNGDGSDHGWGGNTLVMGNEIQGGQVVGAYPQLGLGRDNDLDVGGGVLIPTTSTDELYADLALWFGVKPTALDALFPNLKQFSDAPATQRLGVFG